MKKKMIPIISGVILAMSTTIALASVEYRGGGEWRYGSCIKV